MEPITDSDLLKLLNAIYRFSRFRSLTEAGADEACNRITNLSSEALKGLLDRIVADERRKTDEFIAEMRQR